MDDTNTDKLGLHAIVVRLSNLEKELQEVNLNSQKEMCKCTTENTAKRYRKILDQSFV